MSTDCSLVSLKVTLAIASYCSVCNKCSSLSSRGANIYNTIEYLKLSKLQSDLRSEDAKSNAQNRSSEIPNVILTKTLSRLSQI